MVVHDVFGAREVLKGIDGEVPAVAGALESSRRGTESERAVFEVQTEAVSP